MESWDAYDKYFNKISGITLVRGENIPDGLYHLVSDVLVQHVDGSYLLMQRDKRKRNGGKWEATAGGSALQGEDAITCALRELREETGITDGAIAEVGRVISDENHTLYVEFLCVTDWKKNGIVLQDGETSDFRWVTREELREMRRDELVTERMQKFIRELQNEGE